MTGLVHHFISCFRVSDEIIYVVVIENNVPDSLECKSGLLTGVLQATIREGQQRSVQGALGVLQYGIVLVDVLHYFRVEFILLEKKNQSYVIFTINLNLRRLSKVNEVEPTRVRIQLWRVSKQRKGQMMTQQTTRAWLTYILHLLVSMTEQACVCVFRCLCG